MMTETEFKSLVDLIFAYCEYTKGALNPAQINAAEKLARTNLVGYDFKTDAKPPKQITKSQCRECGCNRGFVNLGYNSETITCAGCGSTRRADDFSVPGKLPRAYTLLSDEWLPLFSMEHDNPYVYVRKQPL